METMDRAYRFSSTPIDPIGLPDGEAAWAWKLGLASIPLEGRIFDPMGFRGYARRGGCESPGSSTRCAYPFQQVAHERDTSPVSWLLVDTHARTELLAGEPPLAPVFRFHNCMEDRIRYAGTLGEGRLTACWLNQDCESILRTAERSFTAASSCQAMYSGQRSRSLRSQSAW